MRRFLLPLLLPLIAATTVQAQTPVIAHGLIIQLKATAANTASRELPNVQRAKREGLAQERMQAIKQGAGVANFAHRELSGEHRLMRFATPLQGQALEDTIRRLRLHPDVASVEPNVRVKLAQTPNDTRFAHQWHLGSSAISASALNMTQTWAITPGTSVVVAVVDTGILPHPDLAGKVLPGYDFIEDVDNANDGNGRDADASDPGDWVTASEAAAGGSFASCDASSSSWHGTFIAGQIAAATNNSSGISGLNWQAKILPVRVSGKCGALLSDILDGMRWAAGLAVTGVPNNANPAKVINLSFGGDQTCSSSYQTVIDELAAVGTLVVVAAGNTQGPVDNMQLKRPADCRGVMAVGAVQANGLKTSYSYVGSNMSLMAPGGHSPGNTTTMLLSTSNAGTQAPASHVEGYKQGTSFSAPLAVGVASLMLAINPSLSPDALILRMKASARSFSGSAPSCALSPSVVCTCNTSQCGAGMLNPVAAVQASYAPAAVIASVGMPLPGSLVTLDGRGSAAVGTPTISSYVWAIQQGSGLVIASPTAALTQVRMPDTPGVFVIQLTVTDTLGQTGLAQLRVDTTPVPEVASTSANAGSSGAGGGGGADSTAWLVLLLVLAVAVWIRSTCKSLRLPHR